MPKRTTATWRPATDDETRLWLTEAIYNDQGALLEGREIEHGLELWDGPGLPCGCIPHNTRAGWLGVGVYCETEGQAYCNFECPHDNSDDVAMVNGDMLGTPSEPGEHVDWNEPEIHTADEWAEILGTDVETYAARTPHMIAWEVTL